MVHATNGTIAFDDKGFQLCRTLKETIDPADWPALAALAPDGIPAANHYRFLLDMTLAAFEDRDPYVTGEEAMRSSRRCTGRRIPACK